MAKRTKLKNNIVRGDTPLIQFPMTVSGVEADLTGFTATFTVTTSENPSEAEAPIIQVQDTGDETGLVEFQLLNGVEGNDTTQLVPGTTYYWDVQLSNESANPGLRIFTVLRGQFGVDADNTWSTT